MKKCVNLKTIVSYLQHSSYVASYVCGYVKMSDNVSHQSFIGSLRVKAESIRCNLRMSGLMLTSDL